MERSHQPFLGLYDQHWHAIRGGNTEQDASLSRDHSIRCRPLVPGVMPIDNHDVVAMDLPERAEGETCHT